MKTIRYFIIASLIAPFFISCNSKGDADSNLTTTMDFTKTFSGEAASAAYSAIGATKQGYYTLFGAGFVPAPTSNIVPVATFGELDLTSFQDEDLSGKFSGTTIKKVTLTVTSSGHDWSSIANVAVGVVFTDNNGSAGSLTKVYEHGTAFPNATAVPAAGTTELTITSEFVNIVSEFLNSSNAKATFYVISDNGATTTLLNFEVKLYVELQTKIEVGLLGS